MSRVLVTGGAGAIGVAVVRRLLSDPAYEVRVADERPAPQWMREGCEVHGGDLREPGCALKATRGCTHVIHLAAIGGGIARAQRLPQTLLEAQQALSSAVIGAAVELGVERFTYVSSSMVFERASEFPTSEAHLHRCPAPCAADRFARLAGEVHCRAAHEEHGLPFTICRPAGAYGPGELPGPEPGSAHVVADLIGRILAGQRPLAILGSGEQTRTLTHLSDIAEGLVLAMSSPAALNDDFNICAARESSVAEIARLAWEACGRNPADFELEHLPGLPLDVQRHWPSPAKARDVLGWQAQIELAQGIAATVRWLRQRGAIGSTSP